MSLAPDTIIVRGSEIYSDLPVTFEISLSAGGQVTARDYLNICEGIHEKLNSFRLKVKSRLGLNFVTDYSKYQLFTELYLHNPSTGVFKKIRLCNVLMVNTYRFSLRTTTKITELTPLLFGGGDRINIQVQFNLD